MSRWQTLRPYLIVVVLALGALAISVAGFFLRGTSISTAALVTEINDGDVRALKGYLTDTSSGASLYLSAEIEGYNGEVLIDTSSTDSASDPISYLVAAGANPAIVVEIPLEVVEDDNPPHTTLTRQLGTVFTVGGVLSFVAVTVGGTFYFVSRREADNRRATMTNPDA